MSNLFVIANETLLYSVLVSFFTQGLGAAANNGGLLYPIRAWMETVGIKKLKQKEMKLYKYREYRRNKYYQQSLWMNDSLKLIELKLLYKSLWHKPLLTCNVCMASFWGTLIFWLLPICHYNIYIWLIGVPIASAITLLTHKLRP